MTIEPGHAHHHFHREPKARRSAGWYIWAMMALVVFAGMEIFLSTLNHAVPVPVGAASPSPASVAEAAPVPESTPEPAPTHEPKPARVVEPEPSAAVPSPEVSRSQASSEDEPRHRQGRGRGRQPEAPVAETPAPVSHGPVTPPDNVAVAGIVATGGDRYALLLVDGHDFEARVGTAMPDGSRVSRIDDQYVYFQKGGGTYALRMKERSDTTSGVVTDNAPASEPTAERTRVSAPAPTPSRNRLPPSEGTDTPRTHLPPPPTEPGGNQLPSADD